MAEDLAESRDEAETMRILLRFAQSRADAADLQTTEEFVAAVPGHLLVRVLLRANDKSMPALQAACARRLEALYRDAPLETIRRELQIDP